MRSIPVGPGTGVSEASSQFADIGQFSGAKDLRMARCDLLDQACAGARHAHNEDRQVGRIARMVTSSEEFRREARDGCVDMAAESRGIELAIHRCQSTLIGLICARIGCKGFVKAVSVIKTPLPMAKTSSHSVIDGQIVAGDERLKSGDFLLAGGQLVAEREVCGRNRRNRDRWKSLGGTQRSLHIGSPEGAQHISQSVPDDRLGRSERKARNGTPRPPRAYRPKTSGHPPDRHGAGTSFGSSSIARR